MTVQLTWGSYGGYSGWMGRGSNPLVVEPDDSPAMRALGVVTSTEGGRPNAFNGYDRCVYSIGYIQLCGATHLASTFLQEAADSQPAAMAPLVAWLAERGISLLKGKLVKNGVILQGTELAKALYGCGGRTGDWTPASKAQAQAFAEVISSVLLEPTVVALQVSFTLRRLLSFVMPATKSLLYPEGLKNGGWEGALQAGFLSFAANLPAVASQHYQDYVKAQGGQRVSDPSFVIGAFKELTFGPKIAIYPARYDAIRRPIERLYGVDLPDFSSDLQKWNLDCNLPEGSAAPTLAQAQTILIAQGFDLGPKGADGVWGKKTESAVRMFQAQHKLTADGQLGPLTWAALLAALSALFSATMGEVLLEGFAFSFGAVMNKNTPVKPLLLQVSPTCRISCHKGYKLERLQGSKWKTVGYHSTLGLVVHSLIQQHPDLLIGADQELPLARFLCLVEEQTASLLHLLSTREAETSGS